MALLAVNPLHVQLSRIARTDVQLTSFIVVSAWFTVSLARHGLLRDYVLAGLLLGMATAIKWPALIFCLTIVVAHFAGLWGQRVKLG